MTKLEGIARNFKTLLKDRGLLIIFVICVVLGVAITAASGKALMDYTAAEEIQANNFVISVAT